MLDGFCHDLTATDLSLALVGNFRLAQLGTRQLLLTQVDSIAIRDCLALGTSAPEKCTGCATS